MTDTELYGPRTDFSKWIHATRHRAPEESFDDYCVRYARAVARDSKEQFYRTLSLLRSQTIMPAGRQQVSVGRPVTTTAFNCFVGGVIEDSVEGIFEAHKRSAITMSSGGGCGWDFSTIRPQGERVRGLGGMGAAAGPIEFMKVWNTMSNTLTRSWARGAMMAVMRIDHPDSIKFINAKHDQTTLQAFNMSLTVPDSFMEALAKDGLIDFQFNGQIFGQARAWDLWGPVMESNWDWAEPGVIFIDRVNKLNPLYYCEQIFATNPCGEQPLPPYGCCLLGSYNMVKFLVPYHQPLPRLDESNPAIVLLYSAAGGKDQVKYELNWELFDEAVEMSVQAYDNVIDRTVYPLPQYAQEEKAKRRMGIGPVGMGDALAIMGYEYGSNDYLNTQDEILKRALNVAYKTSSQLAKEKGSFPLFDVERYAEGEFFKRLDEDVQFEIVKRGLRNGLLTSIAPTGTIALDADNVSGGIEPAFAHKQERPINIVNKTDGSRRDVELINYAYNFYGVKGKTADQTSPEDHIKTLCRAQYWICSGISKTCNVSGQIQGEGPGTTFEQFEQLYLQAYEGGAKSCTTFNLNGKRAGLLRSTDEQPSVPVEEGTACFIDEKGIRSCEV